MTVSLILILVGVIFQITGKACGLVLVVVGISLSRWHPVGS